MSPVRFLVAPLFKSNRNVAQLVAHYVRDVGVGRSSRLIPTQIKRGTYENMHLFLLCLIPCISPGLQHSSNHPTVHKKSLSQRSELQQFMQLRCTVNAVPLQQLVQPSCTVSVTKVDPIRLATHTKKAQSLLQPYAFIFIYRTVRLYQNSLAGYSPASTNALILSTTL